MATTSPIDETERHRRAELVRDSKGALAQGVSYETRNTQREEMADSWSRWLHSRMDARGLVDPLPLLPDVLAELEMRARGTEADGHRR
jgi:hypothetical protein